VRALDIRSHNVAEYFISEVLEQQPPEVVQFMLDTSILGVLTEAACAAVTGSQDAAAMLRGIDVANLFLMPLDDERTSFRYHHLVRQVLRAELRTRDRGRERKLQLRAAEWFESTGETRRAARHFLAARQADRAFVLLQDQIVPDFLQDPVLPPALDLSTVDASLVMDAPDKLLALAADLLLWGDTARGGEYLDLLERTAPIPADSTFAARFAAIRSFHYGVSGQLDQALQAALTARAIQEGAQLTDGWNAAVPLVLLRVHTCLEDFEAVEREAVAALAVPGLAEAAKLVMVPGARALAWFESGHQARAMDVATAAEQEAWRLGFGQHFFAVDCLRALAGLALERRDLDIAEQLIERVLSITERRRPVFEFLALLDRARTWAAQGHVRDALATVEAARLVLARTRSPLLTRADELEALLCLSLGDLRTSEDLAARLPATRRSLLLAKIALAAGDHAAAQEQLKSPSLADLTPRRTLEREILQAATAIERGDPMAEGIVGGVLRTARQQGYLNTLVTTAPQVTRYLIEQSSRGVSDPFTEQLVGAALEVHATQPDADPSRHVLVEPLTAAELRILQLLPTSTYLQIAATLFISRNTVKTHLRSVYQKLGVASRTEAIGRAVDLHLL
jgi:LuxR family maltose regulon positive regulatory protein